MTHPSALPPSPEAIKAWGRLMRVSRQLQEKVENALKTAGLPPLAWYDALHEIAEAGEKGLRPFVLEGRMLFAQYNVSRLLARLEQEGLVEKQDSKTDGRGQTVHITSKGRDMRRRLWAVYGPMIGELMDVKLTQAEMVNLEAVLGKVRLPTAGS